MIGGDLDPHLRLLLAENHQVPRSDATGTRDKYPVGPKKIAGLGYFLRAGILAIFFEVRQLAVTTYVHADRFQILQFGKANHRLK